RADLQDLIAQFDILQGRADSRRVILVQEASPPREIEFPKLKLMLPAGVFLAVLVVAGILFLRESSPSACASRATSPASAEHA
ncbi:MAG: hypothetical protein ACKOGJ_12800, partial [Phycisphaerales bacterium]